MSWSDERLNENKDSKLNKENIINNINNINGILRQYSIDENLTYDLNNNIVKIAIKHWTNEKRLNIDEIKIIEDNYSVMDVLKKIVCLILYFSLYFLLYFSLYFLLYFSHYFC